MAKPILIVEDDQDILEMMTYLLQEEGYVVVSSPKIVSIDYVEALNPALILLDNRIAGFIGGDLCFTLKTNASTRHFPIVIVSAANQLAELAKNSLADSYLPKPFDLDDLVDIVCKYASISS